MKKQSVTINGITITPIYRSTFLYMDDDYINHYREDFHHWEDAEVRRLEKLAIRWSLPLFPESPAEAVEQRKMTYKGYQATLDERYEYLAKLVESDTRISPIDQTSSMDASSPGHGCQCSPSA